MGYREPYDNVCWKCYYKDLREYDKKREKYISFWMRCSDKEIDKIKEYEIKKDNIIYYAACVYCIVDNMAWFDYNPNIVACFNSKIAVENILDYAA